VRDTFCEYLCSYTWWSLWRQHACMRWAWEIGCLFLDETSAWSRTFVL